MIIHMPYAGSGPFQCVLWTQNKPCLSYMIHTGHVRIFHTLMALQQRARMPDNLIRRVLDPFKAIIRKLYALLEPELYKVMMSY